MADPAAAWEIVGWYRQRWRIEQIRLMTTQGPRLETSQLADAAGLIKLAIVAAKAATMIVQLTQACDGTTGEPACLVFTEPEPVALAAVQARFEGKAVPRTPHRAGSLAWAGWIIARLGGWLPTDRGFPGEPRCPGLAMIGMVETSVERAGKTSRARRTYLGSAPFARAVRAHRGVENRLRRLLDVVFTTTSGGRAPTADRPTWPPSATPSSTSSRPFRPKSYRQGQPQDPEKKHRMGRRRPRKRHPSEPAMSFKRLP